MNIQSDYFELFQLPRQFAIDDKELRLRARALQARFHPDRFVGKPAQEQRLAVQYSARINEALQCLASPLQRAAYLLELEGVATDQGATTIDDAEFLMLQLELREQLSDIESDIEDEADSGKASQALGELLQRLEQMLSLEHEVFVNAYNAKEFAGANQSVSRLHFLHKLQLQAVKNNERLHAG